MHVIHPMPGLVRILFTFALSLGLGTCIHAADIPSAPSPSATTHTRVSGATTKAAVVSATTLVKDVELGKVNVKAMKAIIETAQHMKLALGRSFDPSSKLVDQMVCSMGHGSGGVILDCGTQGWYTARRETWESVVCIASEGGCMCTFCNPPTLGHPWHAVRRLTYRQEMALRKLLKELPPPGGKVELVDATGKVLLTVQTPPASSGS